jgi:hypothetical protein
MKRVKLAAGAILLPAMAICSYDEIVVRQRTPVNNPRRWFVD